MKNNIPQWVQKSVLAGLCVLPMLGFSATQMNLPKVAPLDLAVLDKPLSQANLSLKDSLNQSYNLELAVQLSPSLEISEKDILWQVQRAGVPVREAVGSYQQLQLPDGLYNVALQIGKYRENHPVQLSATKRIKPYFRARVGRLEVNATHPVLWQVVDTKGDKFSTAASRVLSEIVAEGSYNISANLAQVFQQRHIIVQAGQSTMTKVDVPIGRLHLIATQADMPLFKPMEWQIYRMENEKRRYFSTYRMHSQTLVIPPGQYEVVASHDGRTQKRQFQVRENTDNRVIVALD